MNNYKLTLPPSRPPLLGGSLAARRGPVRGHAHRLSRGGQPEQCHLRLELQQRDAEADHRGGATEQVGVALL